MPNGGKIKTPKQSQTAEGAPETREEIIEQAVDTIERFAAIKNYTEVGNAIREAANQLNAELLAQLKSAASLIRGYRAGYDKDVTESILRPIVAAIANAEGQAQ